jgi:hypothetical protein
MMNLTEFLEHVGLKREHITRIECKCPDLRMIDGQLAGRLEIQVLYAPRPEFIHITITTNKYLG